MSSEIRVEYVVDSSDAVEDTPVDQKTCPKNSTGTAVVKDTENASLKAITSMYASDNEDDGSDYEMNPLSNVWEEAAALLRDDVALPSSSSSSSSSSSDSEEDSSDSGSDISNPTYNGAIRKIKQAIKDDELDDLPPVPDLSTLSLNTESEKFIHMGNVLGIVDKLVTVGAIPNMPAYDLNTLLFLDNGKVPLGFVFDVLGQVSSPIYAIRFNSVEDIKKINVEIGTKVYSAPTGKHTQYVFLQQLLKMKGSDASWLGDGEVPAEFADYSDDENECFQRQGNRGVQPHMKRSFSGDKHRQFEDTMNRRNALNTKFNKYMDNFKQARFQHQQQHHHHHPKMYSRGNTTGNPLLAGFDPTVPPPNLRINFQQPNASSSAPSSSSSSSQQQEQSSEVLASFVGTSGGQDN